MTSIPQQLVVPITIASWVGKAILDTGASYTLINENLWTELVPQLILQPWNLGPLYLANGEAEVPLGWVTLSITLHHKSFSVHVAVLPSQALAYSVILGLDYLFQWVTN